MQYIVVKKAEADGFPYAENQRRVVKLRIGGHAYDAGVRTTSRQKIVYIAPTLASDGRRVPLTKVLARHGYRRNDVVDLEATNGEVRVIGLQSRKP